MYIDAKCRLCYDTTNKECQHYLHDENGQRTEIYEITVKYFDPMLFIDDSAECNTLKHSHVICNVCWGYIKEFHNFQQCILKTQSQLTENINTSLTEHKEETEIKIEVDNDDDLDEINAMGGEIVLIMENKYYDNDDEANEEEENVKDLTKENEKKPNYEHNDNNNENVQDQDNHKNIQSKPSKGKLRKIKNVIKDNFVDNCSGKERVDPKKRRSRKKAPNDDNYDETKTTHYNSVKKIRELDNFITQVKPQLECEICKAMLSNYNELRQHFTEKHQKKCFVVCCGKKIYRRYLLVEHLRVHVNPDSFKCDICGSSSSSSRSLHSHKRLMHGNIKLLECDVCHKHFKTKPILMRHMDIHNDGAKDFICRECNRCYGSDYQLKAHVNKVHHEAQICDQCGKTVHGKAALKQHIIHQHSGIKPTKFPCDQCIAELASKKGLKAHKLSFHNDGLTAFICKVCGKIASSETALMRHKKYVHEMERKHKCQYCDKAFKKSSNLKEHISTHTGQHLYKCYYCPQTFGSSANMHTHRKKSHPVEFALSRENRADVPKIDLNSVIKEVIL